MKQIYDLSHHNKVTDWSKLKDAFIIHKCTQGNNYLDPTYKERKDKIMGSYHFADGGDAVAEAEWYVKNCNEDFLCLDWEIEHADPVDWCTKFIKRVKEKTGKDCWLYTNDARAVKYAWPKDWKFWIARYADYTGTYYPDFEPKFKNWSIYQYTSRGKVAGIVGNVDLNVAKIDPTAPAIPAIAPSTTIPVETPPSPEIEPETAVVERPKDKQAYIEPKAQLQQLIEDLINYFKQLWKS